jgi:hypothetical protein
MQLLDVSISEAFHGADKEPTDTMLASTDRIFEKEIEENKPSRGKLTLNRLLCCKTTETARKPRMFGTRTKDTKSLIKAQLKHPIVSNAATEMSRTLGEKEKSLVSRKKESHCKIPIKVHLIFGS